MIQSLSRRVRSQRFAIDALTAPLSIWKVLRRKRGWIGVDVGSTSTKIAQLERTTDGYRFLSQWSVADQSFGKILVDEHADVASVTQACQIFRGRLAAATLPTQVTSHRNLELPTGSPDELRQIIKEELAGDPAYADAEPCFDFWETPKPPATNAALTQVSVIDVGREPALCFARNLKRAGLDCRILDGLPWALARAVKIANPNQSEQPVMILEIGHAAAVFVLAVGGRPHFFRVLRGCGSEAFLKSLQSGLRLQGTEAQELLQGVGMADAANGLAQAASHIIQQLLSAPLGKLVGEIKRTLTYLHQSFPAVLSDHLTLCGGGALIPHLSERLAMEIGVDTERWRLTPTGSDDGRRDEAAYAVAAGLSALAWEV